LAFIILSFSNLQEYLVLCVVHAPPCFLHGLKNYSKCAFLGTLFVDPVLGLLVPILFLVKAFLTDGALTFSWGYIGAQ
jgi:hypothetical protein